MKIIPVNDMIQLDIKEPEAGALNLSSIPRAIEFAEVLALGDEVVNSSLKKGDKIFVKAWSIDIVTHENKKYYFTREETNGICAIIK